MSTGMIIAIAVAVVAALLYATSAGKRPKG